jgi:Uri superfamily endonuclease
LTSRPGTYALILASARATRLRIGRLGELSVRPGYYVYCGSAFGPGGLAARVGRHRSQTRRIHWHIDYLRSATRLDEVWFTEDPRRREHDWAAVARELMGGSVPLAGFGASDCSCGSHLHFFRTRPSKNAFAQHVRRRHPGHAVVALENGGN